MFPETSTYLTPLNGTIVTVNPATYPWFSRLNLLPDGFDYELPIRLREKRWGVGSGKHPSHIINTSNDPIEFTLEMEMQDARFIALATGTCSSAGNTNKIIQVITVDTYSDYVDGDQFLLYFVDGTGHIIAYQVYMDVTGDDSGKPTAVVGATAVRIDFVTDDGSANQTTTSITSQATLTAEIEAVLEALTDVTAVTVSGDTITYTTIDNAGAVPLARDHTGNTGITTFSVTTYGASTHTITEATGSSLPSFGIHIEYNNGSEDIIVDLFGCTVVSEEVTVDYEEKVIKESVTISCPMFADGVAGTNISLFPPPKRALNPLLWQDVANTGNNRLLLSGTSTNKTPTIVNMFSIKIENEIELYPELGVAYRMHVIAGLRTVTLNIVGFAQNKDIYTIWTTDTWDNANGRYTTHAAKLNSELVITRTTTYDLWTLSVVNWLITKFDLKVFPIDDKIMGVDIEFEGATPDSSGYIIDSLVISDYVPKIFYNAANA